MFFCFSPRSTTIFHHPKSILTNTCPETHCLCPWPLLHPFFFRLFSMRFLVRALGTHGERERERFLLVAKIENKKQLFLNMKFHYFYNQSTSTSIISPSEEEDEGEAFLPEPAPPPPPPNQSAAGPHRARRASSSARRFAPSSRSLRALCAPAPASGSSSSGASQYTRNARLISRPKTPVYSKKSRAPTAEAWPNGVATNFRVLSL